MTRLADPRDDLDEKGVTELAHAHQGLTGHALMMMRLPGTPGGTPVLVAALCGYCTRVIGETREGREATGGLDHDTIRWDIIRGLSPGLTQEASVDG